MPGGWGFYPLRSARGNVKAGIDWYIISMIEDDSDISVRLSADMILEMLKAQLAR